MPRRNERGGSQSISTLLVVPVMLLAILGAIQAGVWYHGRQTAIAAAQAAAEAERVTRATPGAGERAVGPIAERAGLTIDNVTVQRTPTTVTVTITGRTQSFFDLGLGGFTETATMPREGAR